MTKCECSTPKKVAVISLAVGTVACVGYGLYKYYTHLCSTADEGFVEAKTLEPGPKKVLVLGLTGAGKSKILSSLSGQEFLRLPQSTDGFNVISSRTSSKREMEIWEIGGSTKIRKFWSNFVQDTDVLVFVLDAADSSTFSEAYSEMHNLLADPRLEAKPIIVLANKQDLPNAVGYAEVKELLDLEDVKHHRVQIILTSIGGTGKDHRGIAEFEKLINSM